MAIFNALLNLRELKELYSGKPVCVCPLYKGSIGVTKRFETSGNPVLLPKYVTLEKLNIEFLPKQSGTGDPSPENVRPISGYDSVTVTRCGKNLNPINYMEDVKWATKSTYMVNRLNSLPPGEYTISALFTVTQVEDGVPSIGNYGFFIRSVQKVLLLRNSYNETINIGSTFLCTGTFVKEKEDVITDVYLYPPSNDIASGFSTCNVSNIQIELGSTPTPYEPYQGETSTLTLPETIYGGTVDAVTGVGSKTWGYIASYNGESLPEEWISDRDVYTPETTPTTGAQVAYKLAAPEPFKVTQISIPSLGSENTFFTNGENLDIIYKESSFWR